MQTRPYSLSPRAYSLWLAGLVGVILCVVAVVILLARVLIAATSINDKASDIKRLGGTINVSTAAVLNLAHTNDVAKAILADAAPLSGQLNTTIQTAQGINELAGSINSTAGSIDGIAGQIEGTASSIDRSAASIANSASSINSRAGDINSKLTTVLAAVQGIKSDTGAINGTATSIQHEAKRIDCKVPAVLSGVNACPEGS